MNPRDEQQGFTLVELMIAMVLGLVLMGGALKVLQSTQQSYRLQENMSRLQENGRFAVEMMTRDLRMVGFAHCGTVEDISFHNNVKASSGGVDTAFDYDPDHGIIAVTPPNAIAGSDALRLQRAEERELRVDDAETPGGGHGGHGGHGGGNANLKIAGNALGLQKGDVVTVTNCAHADTFRITNNPGQTSDPETIVTLAHAANANIGPHLQNSYAGGDRLMRLRRHTWFVAETGAFYADGTPATALYRDTGDGALPIVDDVRRLRLRYGVDADGDGSVDSYEADADVADWRRVLAVRVSLLLHTADDQLADGASTVVFGNGVVEADDRRILRVFTTTIALRNRMGV